MRDNTSTSEGTITEKSKKYIGVRNPLLEPQEEVDYDELQKVQREQREQRERARTRGSFDSMDPRWLGILEPEELVYRLGEDDNEEYNPQELSP